MDTNLLSCSKCGHIVSETAESCAYCGTAISSDDSAPQSDEGAPEVAEQAAEAAPLPMDDSSEDLAMTEELASKPDASEVTAGAGPSDQIQPEENPAEITDPAVGAASDAPIRARALRGAACRRRATRSPSGGSRSTRRDGSPEA